MDVEYSIGVNNRFATLLSDEEDTEDVQTKEKDLKKEKVKKADKKVAKPAAKDSKPAGRKDLANEETKKDERPDRRGGPKGRSDVRRENEKNTRMTNGRDDSNREKRGGFGRRRDDAPSSDADSPGKEGGERDRERGGFGSRGRGGGRGGGRGSRGGFGRGGAGGPGRKREFERRSGSDRSSIKPQDKRDGGGQFNWGNPAESNEEEKIEGQEWPETGADSEEQKITNGEEGAGEEEKEEPEKAEVFMSLDEWKKIQEESRVKMEYHVRKAGEGEKKGQWKNTSVLKKDETEDLVPSRRVIEEKIKTSGRVKQTVDINVKFVPAESRNSEPRRGRGGGGRGRGGDRGRGERRGRGAPGGRGGFGGRGRGGGFGKTGPGHDDGTNFDFNAEEFPSLG